MKRLEIIEAIITAGIVITLAIAFIWLKVNVPAMFPSSSDMLPFIVILS